jgi:hypothetical protein
MLTLKIKSSKSFVDKSVFFYNYSFFVIHGLDKALMFKLFNYNNIYHISKFKNFLNLNLKGNFYFCFFQSKDFFLKFELLKKNNIQIHYFSIENYFINYLNILNINNFNLVLYVYYLSCILCFFNLIYFYFYFFNTLNFFLKNVIS